MFSVIRSSLIRPGKQLAPVSYIACTLQTIVIKQYSTAKAGKMPKVAVVLSGCGVYDGSEVHESSAVLVHLSRAGAEISMFAPDVEQMHAINHTKGEPMETNRNVLVESARIARGKISALSNLTAGDFDAVVFPGGFGAAKNLSTFAVDGVNMKVNEDVERVIKDFHANKKPIGCTSKSIDPMYVIFTEGGGGYHIQRVHRFGYTLNYKLCCIAPVLAANVLKGCEVTVGSDKEGDSRWPYAGTAGAIQSMGSSHICKDVSESHTDVNNKIVTTPAFMCETKFHEIFDGVGKMIEGIMKIL